MFTYSWRRRGEREWEKGLQQGKHVFYQLHEQAFPCLQSILLTRSKLLHLEGRRTRLHLLTGVSSIFSIHMCAVCAHVCLFALVFAQLCKCVCICTRECACGGPRLILGIFLGVPPPCLLRKHHLLSQEACCFSWTG